MRSSLTSAEVAYLRSQHLARIATVGRDGGPDVVPVSFAYNEELGTIDIGGHGFASRQKFRDVQRNPGVAVVVDDIASVSPWKVRGIEIRGHAQIVATGGEKIVPGFDPEMFRITPGRISSWGIDDGDG